MAESFNLEKMNFKIRYLVEIAEWDSLTQLIQELLQQANEPLDLFKEILEMVLASMVPLGNNRGKHFKQFVIEIDEEIDGKTHFTNFANATNLINLDVYNASRAKYAAGDTIEGLGYRLVDILEKIILSQYNFKIYSYQQYADKHPRFEG